MPATEQTWRQVKLLHVVFGISSILMFVATIWLLAADHYREWKEYQRKFEQIENWTLVARYKQELTDQFVDVNAGLEAELQRAQAVVPSKELIDRFRAQLLFYKLVQDPDNSPAEMLVDQMKSLEELPLNQLGSTKGQQLLESVLQSLQNETDDATGLIADYDALTAAEEAAKASGPQEGKTEIASIADAIRPERQALLDSMRDAIARVKFTEDEMARLRKFQRADLDALKSKYDLGVRDSIPQSELEAIQERIRASEEKVDELSLKFDSANSQRRSLEAILNEITQTEDAAAQSLRGHEASVDQLQQALADRTRTGRGILEMPVLDAFNSPLKIDQIWLPNLTLNNNFKEVARFDRCRTCHLAIEKTAPGSATEPGYPCRGEPFETALATPEKAPADESGRTLQLMYGFELSTDGVIRKNDVLVEFVWPQSPAARAGLERGDVITHIQVGDRMEELMNRTAATRFLTEQVSWGEPIPMKVSRGVPQPYCSHPRLDLYVGSLSPHNSADFGCTICHEGQGSATSFEWASHTPNNPEQAAEWRDEYGWFDNHHWIFPMRPERFIESGCLKCHHEVLELEPSTRFPEPPAPKLMSGYKLVKNLGCYGCHEINGYDGPDRRVGPDLRTEPQYTAASQQVAYDIDLLIAPADPGLQPAELPAEVKADLAAAGQLADELSWHPESEPVRHDLLRFLESDAGRTGAPRKLLSDPGLPVEGRSLAMKIESDPDDMAARDQLVAMINKDKKSSAPKLTSDSHLLANMLARPAVLLPTTHKLADVLKDTETPGTLRKVGPSLRYVSSKLGQDTLYEWVKNPQSIRATSKMPRFFGLHETHDHLTPAARELAERYEEVEVRAIVSYLFSKSQPFGYAPEFPNVTEAPSAERGKVMFETRGCLACHQHADFPAAKSIFGPNLTNLAAKLRYDRSKKWLRTWLLNPSEYHRRTAMPVTYLDPTPLLGADGKPLPVTGADDKPKTDADGEPVARMTDPAADIATFLLGGDWAADDSGMGDLNEAQQNSLRELALLFLKTAFPSRTAEQYLESGIPARLADTLKGAEVELVPGDGDQEGYRWQYHFLNYVGRRTISRYGCSGCHDIPGFETAKPIGTGLADWGRKETSKLAFEHIVHFVERKYAKQEHHEGDGDGHGAESHHGLDPEELDPDEGYFVEALMHHQREGFLRQKMLEPRSYDYEKADNKPYHDRLRMPQFAWGADAAFRAKVEGRPQDADADEEKSGHKEIEQVMTFVLGLVAEPPAEQYVYHPDPRRDAIVRGEHVLQKFNCAGCHVLELGRWDIAFERGQIEPPPSTVDFPFLEPYFTPEQIAASREPDRRGRLHGTLFGMQRTGKDGRPELQAWSDEEEAYLPLQEYLDEFGREPPELAYNVELWRPTLLDGSVFRVNDPLAPIAESMMENHYAVKGGDYARWLIPVALELARQTEPNAVGRDAWAWVPPPLIGEGQKTKESWLREFLLNPYPIRPGVILRMPKFNMSPTDAWDLVQYFSAHDNEDYPNHFESPSTEEDLAQAAIAYSEALPTGLEGERFGDALKIVLDKSGCLNCHALNDKMPGGSPRGNGPNLANVYKRLLPSYLKRWIAKPSNTLPYTKMQVLFPYKPDEPNRDGFRLPILDAEGKPVLDEDGAPKTRQVYHGTSEQQLKAIVDLLANFDMYLKSQTSISQKVAGGQEAPQTVEPSGAE